MTLLQFAALEVVARHLNITKAAQELRISQPGLSKQLKCLEEYYKTTLFIRTPKGIELTAEALELLNYVRPILTRLRIIQKRFPKRAILQPSAPLRIGGTYGLSSTILPVVLQLYKKHHPDTEIILRSNAGNTLEQMLLKGNVEIVVTSILPRSPLLAAEPCMPLKLVAFAAKGYPIRRERTLDLSNLRNIPLIIRDGGTGRGTMENLFRKFLIEGKKPKVVMRCESPEAIKAAVSKKLGVGILYEDVVKEELKRGLFKRVHISGVPIQGTAYVLYHTERPLSGTGEAFLRVLKQWCKKRGGSSHRTTEIVKRIPADVE